MTVLIERSHDAEFRHRGGVSKQVSFHFGVVKRKFMCTTKVHDQTFNNDRHASTRGNLRKDVNAHYHRHFVPRAAIFTDKTLITFNILNSN